MPRQHISVSLSGGGHRATLFGLGALLYLVLAYPLLDVPSIAEFHELVDKS